MFDTQKFVKKEMFLLPNIYWTLNFWFQIQLK